MRIKFSSSTIPAITNRSVENSYVHDMAHANLLLKDGLNIGDTIDFSIGPPFIPGLQRSALEVQS